MHDMACQEHDPISVLVVDDDPFVRTALRAVVDSSSTLRVAGEAGDGADALRRVAALQPDVVLMDLQMPVMDGSTAIRRLGATPGGPPVVVLTNHLTDSHLFDALSAGATGFLVKDAGPTEIIAAIRAAHAGDAVLSAEVTRQVVDAFVDHGRRHDRELWRGLLTSREREVALAVAAGHTNQQIADSLYMSLSTVKTNVSRIMDKLQLSNRVQIELLVHGIELG